MDAFERLYSWAIIFALALLIIVLVVPSRAHARDLDGRWAQQGSDPWWKDQKVPGTNRSCCSDADGTYVEEDIRKDATGSHYWARWSYRSPDDESEIVVPWTKVPDEVIIYSTTPRGLPVVWWGIGSSGGVFIRCYAPGAQG